MKVSNGIFTLSVLSISAIDGFIAQTSRTKSSALASRQSYDEFRTGGSGASLWDTNDRPRPGTDRYGRESQDRQRVDYGTDRYVRESQGRRGVDRYDYQSTRGTGRIENPSRGPDRYDHPSQGTYGPERYGYSNQERDRYGRTVQGNSRQTFYDPYNGGQTTVSTDGRPLNANVELWDGPNNTPHRMKLYSEDGNMRPWHIETPGRSRGNVVSVRNTGPMEFPVTAGVGSFSSPTRSSQSVGSRDPFRSPTYGSQSRYDSQSGYGTQSGYSTQYGNSREPFRSPMNEVQQNIDGGALRTWSLGQTSNSIRVSLYSEGRPIEATVELWGVGNHVKQSAEIYSEDGDTRPTILTINPQGYGGTIAIRNIGHMAFPLTARVEV